MPARSRTTALAVAVVAVVAAVAACTSVTGGQGGPAPTLDRFYAQELSWGPCAPFAQQQRDREAFADRAFDCARLEVPLDYAAPAGRTAQIGVLRLKARGDKIGSLVTNPGGPGASGMSLVPSLARGLAQSPITGRFDLIGFDPRGVGASTPAIDCLVDAEREVERADLDIDPSPAGVAQTEAENRQYAEKCSARTGPDVLATVGTREVARDMDVLRSALGDAKLTYLGYSYGTRIGSTYAEAFPQNVRALVLDGALDPNKSSVEELVAQGAGFQQAFDAYAADCARRPACPLGADPAQAVPTFQQLTRPLLDAPLRLGSRTLSYNDALTGVIQALYLSEAWPILSRGISGLASGDGRILMALADLYEDRAADGTYSNKLEGLRVIRCVDEDRITDREVVREAETRYNQAAPFRDGGRGVVAALDPCAFWPVPPTGAPHVPVVGGLPRTLVVSVTGDPATPYQAGVDLAAALAGALLTAEGNQHTASLQGNACVDGIVAAYLIELRLPDGESRCAL